MGSRLVQSPRWPGLLVTCVAALLALSGTAPRRAQAQPAGPEVHMTVNFSPNTPPLKPGVICKGQNYQIEVQPLVVRGAGLTLVPLFGGAIFSRTPPLLGTLSNGTLPPTATLPTARTVDKGGTATFIYRAHDTGTETLVFSVAHGYLPPTLLSELNPSFRDLNALETSVTTDFQFQVRECYYSVTMLYERQQSQQGATLEFFGNMTKLKLERKPDNTFDGKSFVDLKEFVSFPGCSASATPSGTDITIEGTVKEDTKTIHLTFAYGTGSISATVACFGASGGGTVPIDMNQFFAFGSADFPEEGGVKAFTPAGNKFTVIVEPETSE